MLSETILQASPRLKNDNDLIDFFFGFSYLLLHLLIHICPTGHLSVGNNCLLSDASFTLSLVYGEQLQYILSDASFTHSYLSMGNNYLLSDASFTLLFLSMGNNYLLCDASFTHSYLSMGNNYLLSDASFTHSYLSMGNNYLLSDASFTHSYLSMGNNYHEDSHNCTAVTGKVSTQGEDPLAWQP